MFDEDDRVEFPYAFLSKVRDQNRTCKKSEVVVWGGASKGVIFSLLKQRMGQEVSVVVDINPAKQGKYLSSTGIQVKAPNDVIPYTQKTATIFVMNSNYLQEIKDMSGDKFNYVSLDDE